ncbi:hypothetical protein GCM10010885_10430 [Alicyclobacillus cellulosilyticus]|uniref:DUF3987 domain-containing protein n=1 Tax=Alicyclobacillus cellulosilyticus TaxID=1003997 RepID=A0A917K6P7_9BACL|nr:YfjI family protein [Alicyclobacillus cellulosilyticus]GGJ03054.1 hypothetical protein GCM10010885_10430 [Alicyclobacillus cellulosilyticus]
MNMTGITELEAIRRARMMRRSLSDLPEKLTVPFKTEAVEPFPVEVFPEPLARFAAEGAASLCCPVDFLAMPMLSVAGVLIGNSTIIRAKADWEEYARIWTLIVGDPGSGKTPALELVLEPLHVIQRELADRFEAAQAAYEEDVKRWAEDKSKPKPVPPVMEQVYTTDTTIEALAEVLARTERGLLIYQEEAAGWVLSLNQYKGGRGSDKQHALSLWNGAPIMVNRRGRQPTYIPRPFVGFTGGIQPEILGQLRNEMSESDGFIHRFLIVSPDPVPKKRTEAVVSEAAKWAWDKACRSLMALEPAEDGPYPLGFTADGLEAWHDWIDAHYEEQNAVDFPDHLRGPWAKLESYSLRLALVLHMLRVVCREIPDDADVDAETMVRTTRLLSYLKSHTRRVYAELRETPEDRKVRLAVAWLQKRGGEATLRDFLTYKVAGTKTASDACNLADLLTERGHAYMQKAGRTYVVKLVTELETEGRDSDS